jgi:hypothetical protein
MSLSEYNIDTVFPTGYFTSENRTNSRTDWTIQVSMFAFGDILHDMPLGSGSSDQFNIVPGGPSPQISVTVLNTATLSTIGGTIYIALTGDAAGQGDFAISAFTPIFTTTRPHNFGGQTTSTTSTPSISTSASTSTDTSLSTPVSNAAEDVDGLSQGGLIGVAVGVTAVVVIGACFAGWWFWPRRRRTSEKLVEVDDIPLSSGRLRRETLGKEGVGK